MCSTTGCSTTTAALPASALGTGSIGGVAVGAPQPDRAVVAAPASTATSTASAGVAALGIVPVTSATATAPAAAAPPAGRASVTGHVVSASRAGVTLREADGTTETIPAAAGLDVGHLQSVHAKAGAPDVVLTLDAQGEATAYRHAG